MAHNGVWEAARGALGGGTAWWLFSTFIQTMPAPDSSSRWYRWLYIFMQRLAANHGLSTETKK